MLYWLEISCPEQHADVNVNHLTFIQWVTWSWELLSPLIWKRWGSSSCVRVCLWPWPACVVWAGGKHYGAVHQHGATRSQPSAVHFPPLTEEIHWALFMLQGPPLFRNVRTAERRRETELIFYFPWRFRGFYELKKEDTSVPADGCWEAHVLKNNL